MTQQILPAVNYHTLPFAGTGYCSPLIADFLAARSPLSNFYEYNPINPDFHKAMLLKATQPVRRDILAEALYAQYRHIALREEVRANIGLLQATNTFTICTAHQPNVFTGYLYFVYKILQAVKLAQDLQRQYPKNHFVPVYYMGSEDADLEELGSIFLEGRKLTWETDQTGAVGRMNTKGLDHLISEIEAVTGNLPHAPLLLEMLRKAYLEHKTVQEATLYLVNELFGCYGVVVLIPDNPAFKQQLIPVMEEELKEQSSEAIVSKTIGRLAEHYKVQATPREINLFYLTENSRERIVKEGDVWKILHTSLSFTWDELRAELHAHPERFSPNVILRGILQETILPNIAFIGGGGEVAYWLELQDLFRHHKVPYPVVLLRNSFLWIRREENSRLKKLGIAPVALFEDTELLVNRFVHEHTNAALVLREEYAAVEKLYNELEEKARSIDVTLVAAVNSERTRAIKSIGKLEHKFLRAEKKKFQWQTDQIRGIKDRLFPGNSLQERKENFISYYAQYGPSYFDDILKAINPVTDQLIIISEL
ncbi:bacillithiol biosynthesis cysteine-adding enzyme BshC [Chitinophaga barathri]|uniref:bacillithiol biosynthesis cysteine-adding enzyme BshC n=1 Tax=Chitinophaga barathri TaxID=1647451 RepID=UPI0013C4D5CB|nr:bacillithiol biosynthesis cysteine-adding enzyme BshC [Chitinophaga barathri]